jgi:hypothetical protein
VRVGVPTDTLNLAHLGQCIVYRDRIHRGTVLVQVQDRPVNRLVRRAVKIPAVQNVRDVTDRVTADKHRTKDGLLGYRVMRWGFLGHRLLL